MRNIFGILTMLIIALLMVGACETPAENVPTPSEVPIATTPAPQHGIGVRRAEMQATLEEDPFGFTFDPPSLVNGPPNVLGYSLEEGQDGVAVLTGPPSNLSKVVIMTPITGEYSRIGVLRLGEAAFHATQQEEQGDGADIWVVEHISLAMEEGTQNTRYDDICLQMEWFDDLQVMALVIERCDT
ncbi:MAG: hypothetical protein F4Y44_00795 [Chloroflexi bacterium]|nr:hypothetical protein [Chloroflexota bacterium]